MVVAVLMTNCQASLKWKRGPVIPILHNPVAFRDCFVAPLLAMTRNFAVIASEAKQSHASFSSSREGRIAAEALEEVKAPGRL